MRSIRRAPAAAFLLFVLLTAADAARGAEKAPPLPAVGIGYQLTEFNSPGAAASAPIADPTASPASPLFLRLDVLWAEIEKSEGVYAWDALDAIVNRFRDGAHEVILDLWGGNPLYSEDVLSAPLATDTKAMDAWTRFVREAARHFKGRVRCFEIGKAPNAPTTWSGQDPARSYAFLLKKSAVTVRAEIKGAVIVAGGIAGADAAWLEGLYAEGTVPYVDAVSFRPAGKIALGAQCDALQAVILEKDASAKLWIEGVPVAGSGEEAGRDIARKLLVGIDHGATMVGFALPWGPDGFADGAGYLVRLHSSLGAAFGRVPSSEHIAFVDPAGQPVPGIRAVSFYNAEKGIAAIGYWAESEAPATATARISARRPGPPLVYDPVAGTEAHPVFAPETGGAKGEVPASAAPQFLIYREGVGSGEALAEESASLEVSAARGISADEIIAHYREFQAAQDAHLQHYRSEAMINFHFRLSGTSTTIDVGMGGTYFYDPGVGAEWEIRDYYLNGNKSHWKDFPELPLIQPEKVVTLPLDITFDRSYSYEYVGEDTVDGRACYELAFNPVDPNRALYRGHVWIDKSNWARVRVSSVQTKVQPPFLSNEEKTTYRPFAGSDGFEYWPIAHIDGQQIFSTGGRNFIVLREIDFKDFLFNDTGFAEARSSAYKSEHQMLRDTDKGFRYLEKTPEGERRVKDSVNMRQFFGLAGVLYDPGLSHPVPLIGANYFDYSFLDSGIQTNLFFAGAFLSLNATHPNIGGTHIELGGDLSLSALAHIDRQFEGGEEIDELNVKTREQSISFNLGRQIGDFLKLRTTYDLTYQAFDDDEDTDHRFVLPKDTLVQTAQLFGSYNRSGYEVQAQASYSVRRTYEYWGCPPDQDGTINTECDKRAATLGQDFNPDGQSFAKWELGGSKEFFLPYFQKLRFAATGYGSSDLDRFSRYNFDRFNVHLQGFGGSGIRWDSGYRLRGAYLFNVAGAVQFEAGIDQAHVKTKGLDDETTDHTGIGISANILGPWKTVWQLDYGYALKSDIKETEGNQEVLLVILKLFGPPGQKRRDDKAKGTARQGTPNP